MLTRLAAAIIAGCALAGQAHAESVSATCSLEVDGRKIWDGKCCVEQSAMDDGAGGFIVDVEAQSLRACVYQKKHPEQTTLPTSQKKCFGPWIVVSQIPSGMDTSSEEPAVPGSEGREKLSVYWSIQDACHAEMTPVAAFKTGSGAYRGAHFRFHWEQE
jgi:hypothetical protein